MTLDKNHDRTRRFALLANLDADALRALEGDAQKLLFRRGESFLLTGDPEKSVLFLEYGRLMRRSADFILELVEPGTVFGERSPRPERRASASESRSERGGSPEPIGRRRWGPVAARDDAPRTDRRTRAPVIRGEALDTCCVWVIPKGAFDAVVKERPLLAAKIDRIIGNTVAPEALCA